MKLHFLIPSIIGLVLLPSQSVRAQSNPDCSTFLSQLPQSYKRAWVQVPENWQQPHGRQIQIFYYTQRTPQQTPIAFFYGGPLGQDHYSYTQFDQRKLFRGLDQIAKKMELGFIYIDQRGTGCSDPVPTGSDLGSNLRASFYSTDQIVHDAEYLRKNLIGKHQKWKIFGQSYGGEIVNRYIGMYPTSIISAHNYAGGFVDHFVQFMFERMLRQDRVVKIFIQRYPKSLSSILKLKNALSDSDCIVIKKSKKVCGQVLADSYLDAYLGSPEDWPALDRDLPLLFLPNGRLDLEKIKKQVSYIFDFFFSENIFPMTAVWNQEAPSAHPSGSAFYDCEQAYILLRKSRIDPSQFLVDHCRIVQTGYDANVTAALTRVIPNIPVRRLQSTKNFLTALRSQPQLKYYVYSGSLDFYDVSSPTYQKISREKQVHYTNFPNNGHFGYYNEPKFWNELAIDRQ